MSTTTIRALEDGTNHHELRLAFLQRLATALGWTVHSLFSPLPPPTTAPPATTDDAVLEALLVRFRGTPDRNSVASALHWNAKRLHRAETRLATRLAGTGVRLHSHWGLSLQANPLLATDDCYRALLRAEHARRGISFGQAALLRRLLAGELDASWHQTAGNANRVLLGELRNLGWATSDGNGGFLATDAVKAAFAPAQRALSRAGWNRD